MSWNDTSADPRTLRLLTSAALPQGTITLELRLTSAGNDVVLLDALTLPTMMRPLPTLAPALERVRLAPPLITADQLIISHPELIPALAPLITAKQQRGQQLAIADIRAIYDQYAWGERHPEAIRQYIQEGITRQGDQETTRWGETADRVQPVSQSSRLPVSVLLVGAGSTRMRVGLGEADPTLLPPYLLTADGVYGEIACDTCYGRLMGSQMPGQLVPDLAIGRLPARTLAEAEVLVAKTLAALNPAPGAWQRRMLLVADNDRDALGTPDSAGPFTPILDTIAQGMPQLQPNRFVYAPDQATQGGFYHDAPALRDGLFTAWDAGAALIGYSGHASAWQWAFTSPNEPVAHLVSRSDAVRTNGTRLPILLSMTCLSGSFANPTLTAIDEELLRQAGGGIVAAFSPNGSGVNTGHTAILAGMLPVLARGETLGAAHLAGLQALVASGHDLHLAYSYGILGDPALALPAGGDARVSLPLVRR
jgi:hypothetical protein